MSNIPYVHDRNAYDFVTIPNDIIVDGGIMPARDVANDGTSKILRGEDPAFLIEGMYERCAVSHQAYNMVSEFSATPPYQMTKVIKASRLADLVTNFRRIAGVSPTLTSNYFGKKYGGTASGVIECSSWGAYAPDVLDILGLKLAANDMASSPADFTSGAALSAENIRKLFYDLGHMRSCQRATIADIYVKSPRLSDGSTPSSGLVYEFVLSGSARTMRAVTGGTFTITIADALDYIGSVRIFGCFSVYHRRKLDDGTIEADEEKYVIYPLASTYDNTTGLVTIASSEIGPGGAIYAIRSHFGFPEPQAGSGYSYSTTTQTLEWLVPVVTLGDHTDISSIGWQWTP